MILIRDGKKDFIKGELFWQVWEPLQWGLAVQQRVWVQPQIQGQVRKHSQMQSKNQWVENLLSKSVQG